MPYNTQRFGTAMIVCTGAICDACHDRTNRERERTSFRYAAFTRAAQYVQQFAALLPTVPACMLPRPFRNISLSPTLPCHCLGRDYCHTLRIGKLKFCYISVYYFDNESKHLARSDFADPSWWTATEYV